MYGPAALTRFWSSSDNSTKLAMALGALTFLSHVWASMPLETMDVIGLAMSAASIALTIYVVHCLNRGSCSGLAWIVALAPIITFALAITLPSLNGIRITNTA